MLQFIDLGGHEKYLKTALFGMTCLLPDFVILTLAAPQGLDRGTLEHLAAAITLQIPTAIVLTKVGPSQLPNNNFCVCCCVCCHGCCCFWLLLTSRRGLLSQQSQLL